MAQALQAAIFDVDGVLVASPHERAWREALAGYVDPAGFSTTFYQAHVAGRPRMEGALAALQGLGDPQATEHAPAYAETKQALIDRLIAEGSFEAFADAMRLAAGLDAAGAKMALASSSKNAAAMLSQLNLPDGRGLLSVFDADLCGHDVPRGKPDPALFLLAAAALGVPPAQCMVVEDAPAGIRAAKAGGMAALGIARLGDEALLRAAGADLVLTSLDQLDIAALASGVLRIRPFTADGSMREALEPSAGAGWTLSHQGYSVLSESAVESRFAIGNGFMGMRASRSVGRGPTWLSWLGYLRWGSWPRSYVAGLFDIPNIEPPVPALVPIADWSRARVLLDGERVLDREGEMIHAERWLDMRRGLLLGTWTHRTPAGITLTGRELRMLSQADRATGLQLIEFTLDRDGVEVELEASFALSGLGMEPLQISQEAGSWRTEGRGRCVAITGAASLQLDGGRVPAERSHPMHWEWRWRSSAGQTVQFDRIVAVARTDMPEQDPGGAAAAALERNRAVGWRAVLQDHEAAWAARWIAADVVVDGDGDLQWMSRFAAYHLISAANPEDDLVSVGARALTGDAYFGHVFWDTEIYLLPFYTAVWPEAARAMLMYRFHTLPGARAKAERMGYRGALYAWESADTGEETTPEHVVAPDGTQVDILCGKLEQHISADVAYAVWQYWRASGDDAFFLSAGAEILLETARFWASRAAPEADGRRHIRNVIGPDEYHEGVDDNAFTNVLARWTIARALEAVDLLRARWPDRAAALGDKLGLGESELADWRDAVDRMVTGLDPTTGLYEQFAGFHDLEPLDLAAYADRKTPIDVIIGRDRTQRSQVVKQADVVALIALLPEEFPGRMAETNFRHYEPRCAHGSSLSPAMHAMVAARLGDTALAMRYLSEIAQVDSTAGAAGGVRIAGLGGIWQAMVMGFGGLDLTRDVLTIDPRLPPNVRSLSYRVCWRGRSIAIRIADDAVQATLGSGEPIDVRLAGEIVTLTAGAPMSAPLRPAAAKRRRRA